MDKNQALNDYIKNQFSNEEIIRTWNRRCSYENMDDYVYENGEDFFNENFEHAYDAVMSTIFGSFDRVDTYIVFNGYGNLDTFNEWDDSKSPIYLEDIVQWIADGNEYDGEEISQEDLATEFLSQYDILDDYYDMAFEYLIQNYNLITDDWDDIETDLKEYLSTENIEEEEV